MRLLGNKKDSGYVLKKDMRKTLRQVIYLFHSFTPYVTKGKVKCICLSRSACKATDLDLLVHTCIVCMGLFWLIKLFQGLVKFFRVYRSGLRLIFHQVLSGLVFGSTINPKFFRVGRQGQLIISFLEGCGVPQPSYQYCPS